MAAKYQEDDCLDCHGADLAGGSVGVSCDSCHTAGWRTDCTFCHGGTDNATGAPPRDLSNETTDISFTPHTTHVSQTIKPAYDCVQCHQKPTDVLSAGHFLVSDATPGLAEVAFGGGLSPAASYASGSCSNLYCHGNGRGNNGSARVGQDFSDCSDCHPDITSGEDGWDRMSGEHDDHLEDAGLECWSCHGLTVGRDQSIADPTLHVNGAVDLLFEGSISYVSGTCDGVCHGESHDDRDWD